MTIVNNKYTILDKIGSGSFGSIYKGQNIRTKEYVAIKVEPINTDLKLLKNESNIYQYLHGCTGIPNVKWFGKDDINYYMVINLLGVSLQDLKNKVQTFSLGLVLKIGIKIIGLLKTIHEKGLVHRDIKPDNFLFGPNGFTQLYLIDFGFCRSYIDNNVHIPMKPTHSMIGSRNYASIMSHRCHGLSRRDDVESLSYMLFYFCNGSLPWSNEYNETTIIHQKEQMVYNDAYPSILVDLLRYARTLTYEETPNYFLLINKFQKEIELLSKTS